MRVSCVILYTNLPIFFKQGLFSRKRQCRLWLFDETNKTDPLIGIFITALSIFWYQILILFCYFQEKRIQFETNLNSIKDKGKELIDKTKDKGHELLHRWEERSKDFIGNFLEMFGRDGRLVGGLKKINYLYYSVYDSKCGEYISSSEAKYPLIKSGTRKL